MNKTKKMTLKKRSSVLDNHPSYTVKKLVNMLKPEVGTILGEGDVKAWVDNRNVQVEIV